MKKFAVLIMLFMVLLSGLSSCSGRAPENVGVEQKGKKIKIVTSFLPLRDMAVNIGGELAEVYNILPPGASPHTYSPTVDDARAIEGADMILMIGLGIDDWVKKMIAGSGDNLIILSRNVDTLPNSDKECDCGHDDCDEVGNADPHVWLSPKNMSGMAEAVFDAMVKRMPEQRAKLDSNLKNYQLNLNRLDQKFAGVISGYENRKFVTYHSFLQYMAVRYGMEQSAVITASPGTSPDPAHIAGTIDLMRREGVKVIFIEPQFSAKASELLSRETGAKLFIIDPLGDLKDPRRNSYVNNMEENLKTLKEAFDYQNGNGNTKPADNQ